MAPQYRLILFYDGQCGLCARVLRWVLRWERSPGSLHFAPLQGETARAQLPVELRSEPLDSVVLWEHGGAGGPARVRVRAQAVRGLAPQLRWPWRGVVWGMFSVPGVSEGAYRWVSRHRHRVGMPAHCEGRPPNLNPQQADRFLP